MKTYIKLAFLLALVSCGAKESATIYNGTDGQSCSVGPALDEESQEVIGALITCANSAQIILNGEDGASCSIRDTSNGALITCGNNSVAILDGERGPQGLAAPTVIGISAYIRPCGSEFANDEIFLRMSDNNILALYDGGPHEDRLVLLAPGNYITTDRNRNNTCNFTVSQSLEITNQRVQ